MATTYDNASLVMIPSGVKESKLYSIKPTDGSGDFTFSRGTDTATRVNASGLIEKERSNQLLQSNTFSTTWSLVTASVTGGQSGYDGSSDAWLLDKSGAFGRVEQALSYTGLLTFSAYLKSGTSNYGELTHSSSGAYAGFSLDDGTIVGSFGLIDSSITSVGNGWYRCSITFNSSGVPYWRIIAGDVGSDTSSGTSGNILIQDAQLNHGLVAQDYIETTTAAVYEGITDNLPRLDYSGGASCPSLLLEPSRTNIFTQSEWSGGWAIENATGDYNNAISPEGVQNAVLLTANGGSQDHTTYVETTSLSPNTYTFTAFVKKGTQRYVHLTLNERFVDSSWITATFDLDELTSADHSSGTGYVDGTSDITDYGNDWYRLEMTGALVNTTTYLAFVGWANGLGAPNTSRGRYNVTTSGTFYAYGAQLEAGTYPTSYIPTYGTSASRAQDVCLKTSISDLIGQTEGTLFFDWIMNHESPNTSEDLYTLSMSDGTGNKLITINNYNQTLAVFIKDTTTQFFDNSYTSGADGARIKLALAYANNDIALYINGVQIATDSSATIPTLSQVRLNTFWNGNLPDSSSVNQLLLFKTRLTNAELAALTA